MLIIDDFSFESYPVSDVLAVSNIDYEELDFMRYIHHDIVCRYKPYTGVGDYEGQQLLDTPYSMYYPDQKDPFLREPIPMSLEEDFLAV
jgi:hypothetical protein